MRSLSLTQRFTLGLLLITLLPMAVAGYTLLNTFKMELQLSAEQQMAAIADKKSDQIDNYLIERLHDARMLVEDETTHQAMNELARTFAATGADSNAYRQLDSRYRGSFSRFFSSTDFYDLFLITPQGRVVYSQIHEPDFATNLFTGPYRNTQLAQVTRMALTTLEGGLSGFEFYAPSRNAIAAFIAIPIMAQGRVEGVLALQLDTNRIFQVLTDNVGMGRSGETVVGRLEQSGNARLMAPLKDEPEAALRRIIPLGDKNRAAPLAHALNGERGSGLEIAYNGTPVIAAWRYLPRMEWGMVVNISADEALAPYYRVRNIAIATLAATLLAIFCAVLLLGRHLTLPLRALSRSAQEIAAGQFNQRVVVKGKNELGELASAFNTMAEKLRISYHHLEQQVDERTTALRQALLEEQRTRRELQYERDYATSLINTAPVIVLLLDTQGIILHANPYFEALSGYRLDEIRGRDWFSTFLSPRDQLRIRTLFQRSTHDMPVRGNINPIVTRSGEERQIEWNDQPMRDPQGAVSAILAIGLDVTAHQAMEEALRHSAEQLNEAQCLAQVGSWELDLVNGELNWSDQIFHIFEIDKGRFSPTYEAFLNAIHPDDRARVDQAYNNSLITRTPYEINHRLLMGDGRIKWVQERCQTEFDCSGTPLRSRGTVQEITARIQAEQALAQSEALFRTLAQVAPVGIFRTDATGSCTFVNERYCDIAGITLEEAQGSGWGRAIHPDDLATVLETWDEAVKARTPFMLEYRFRRPDGRTTWVVGQARAELDGQGGICGYVGTITDISNRKEAEEEVRQLAFYDHLTGLANRRLLLDRLQRALAASQRSGEQGALLFIDLDNFKQLNDSHGHEQGDLLLQQVAQRLKASVRETDTVARLGGDEFIVILEQLSRTPAEAQQQAVAVAEKILSNLNQPYPLSKGPHHATPSIGITLISDHHSSLGELLQQADTAMYQSKLAGRNTLRCYQPPATP